MTKGKIAGVVLLGGMLNILELLLRIWSGIVNAVVFLLEDIAEIIVTFLVLFGVLYAVINIAGLIWPSDVTAGLHTVVIMIIAFAIIIAILRSVGDTGLTFIAGLLEFLEPDILIAAVVKTTKNLALTSNGDQYRRTIAVIERVAYWCGKVVGILVCLALILGFAAIGGNFGYCCGFIWGPPPAYLALDWYFCVGFAVLLAGIAGYIGFTLYDGFRVGFLIDPDENE